MILGASACFAGGCIVRDGVVVAEPPYGARLRALERRAGGRLGAYILDAGHGTGFGWRADERFPHCSSFKMSLAALVLNGLEVGDLDGDEILHWDDSELLPYSPVTEAHIASGLSLEALAHGAVVQSDNTAANLLLRKLGGPARLTAYWRSLGDGVSRLDRYEPELNQTPPGTELDTSTPVAMATTAARLLFGDALSAPNQRMLRGWLHEVQTGSSRLRAAFPADWVSGDKTGTWLGATVQTYVDVAFGVPPGRPPVVVAAYFEPSQGSASTGNAANAVLAEVGRVAVDSLQTEA